MKYIPFKNSIYYCEYPIYSTVVSYTYEQGPTIAKFLGAVNRIGLKLGHFDEVEDINPTF